MEATTSLLNYLGLVGYRVSKKAAQIAKGEIRCLGFNLSKRRWALGEERKEAICRIVVPKTKKQLRGVWEIWLDFVVFQSQILY